MILPSRKTWSGLVSITVGVGLAVGLTLYITSQDYTKLSSLLVTILGLSGLAVIIGITLLNPKYGFVLFTILLSVLVQLRYYATFTVGFFPVMPVGLALALLLLVSLPYTQSLKVHRLDLLITAFVIFSALPLLWARDKNLALLSYEQAVLEPFVAYLLVRMLFRGEGGIRWLLIAIGLSFWAMIGYLAVETLRGGGLSAIISGNASRQYSAVSTIFRAGYGEPIAVAAISLYAWPVLFFVYRWSWRYRWIRLMFWGLTWMLPIVVVITISRRHLIILLLVSLTLVYWSYRYRLVSLRTLLLILMVGFSVTIVAAPPYIQRFITGKGVISDPDVLEGRPLEISTLRYVAEHFGAVEALKKHPLGIGGFNGDHYWSLYNPSARNFRWYHPRLSSIFIPYLEIGIHFGWIALGIFVVYFLRLLKITWGWATDGHGLYKYLGAGLFTSLLWNGLLESMGAKVSWAGFFEHLPVNAFAIWAFILFALIAALCSTENDTRRLIDQGESGA